MWVHVLAQAAIVAAPTSGTIAYGPEFFADLRPVNALEMVERLPGFSVSSGADVRGYEGAAGNVLVDGRRPAAKTDSLEAILRRIPAGQVARIELIRGGAPGVDMQSQTVLANVVRKTGGGFRGLAQVSAFQVLDDGRTYPSVRLEGSGGANGRTWEASLLTGAGVDDVSGDGFSVRIDPQGRVVQRAKVESEGSVPTTTTATAAFETPFAGGALRLNARLFVDEYNFEERDDQIVPVFAQAFDQFGEDVKEAEIGARFNRPLGPRTTLEVVALQRYRDSHFGETFRDPSAATLFALERESGESIGRGVLKFIRDDRLSFETGGEGAFNSLRSRTRFSVDGTPVDVPAANVRIEETRGEAFAKATWRPSAAWTVEGGLRQEVSRIRSRGDVALEKTLAFAKPRLVVTWAPDAASQLRLRAERVVGQLDFDAFVATTSFVTGGGVRAGNPDLEPERQWVAEAAFERRFWGAGAAVVTLRHIEIHGVVDRAPIAAPTGTFDAPANIGAGQRQEAAVSLTLPFDRLGWRGAQLRGEAVWRRSEVDDPTTGDRREISGLAPLIWEAHFTYDLPAWRTNLGFDIDGASRRTFYRFDRVEVRKLKTYVTLFAEWKPSPELAVRAELLNVTERGARNSRDIHGGPRDTSPRQFIDDRDLQFGRVASVRVRRTFGGPAR